jgi:hypothetical protein
MLRPLGLAAATAAAAAAAFAFLPPLCFLPPTAAAAAGLAAAAAAGLAAAAAAGAAAPAAPCWTTTQLPNPAVLTNSTTHLFLLAPPVHLVPAGSATVSWSEPTAFGAYTPHQLSLVGVESEGMRTALPFFVTVALTNLVPVPVASTLAANEREPSPPALKSTAVAANVPSAATVIALLLSIVAATLVPPQFCSTSA